MAVAAKLAARESPAPAPLKRLLALREVYQRTGLDSYPVGLGAHACLDLLRILSGAVERRPSIINPLNVLETRPREVELQVVVGRFHPACPARRTSGPLSAYSERRLATIGLA